MNIQWYPGHMTKAKRAMKEDVKLVDLVIELVDARAPLASRNPDIDSLAAGKGRVILLNKADLASEKANAAWISYFEGQGFQVMKIDARAKATLKQLNALIQEACKEKIERDRRRGILNRPVRAMVVGIPNVGKSTFINSFAGKAAAKTGNKPGVTKGNQWIRLNKQVELLDTPGILWPKFEDQQVGLKLAFTGAINDDILDPENMAIAFINHMISRNPDCLRNRYQITFDTIEEPHVILEKIAMARGFKKKGDEPDLERAGKILMDEYRGGKLGRLTLELPEDIDVMLEQKKARAAEKAVLDKERKKAYNNKKKK